MSENKPIFGLVPRPNGFTQEALDHLQAALLRGLKARFADSSKQNTVAEGLPMVRIDTPYKKTVYEWIDAWRPGIIYSLESLVKKATSGSRVCMYPNQTKPTLLFIGIEKDTPELTSDFIQKTCVINNIPFTLPLQPDGEFIKTCHRLIQDIGYNVHLIRVPNLQGVIPAIEQFDLLGRVVGVTIDVISE